MRVSEFIARCNDAGCPEGVFDSFQAAMQEFGYPIVGFIPVTLAAREAAGLTDLAPAMGANIPADWQRHYLQNSYQAFDPVLLRTPFVHGPLTWSEVAANPELTAKQRRVLAEGQEAGMFNGASIPLHGPRGETYIVSLASDDPSIDGTRHLPEAQIMAVQFLLSYAREVRRCAGQPAFVQITDRERECLTWTARGKSAWAIGKILGVSEHTVTFHLRQSMEKLGAGNRMQAVVSAVRLGLILP
jgi:LuxR family quorum-sensing system transcriptional regulator CciR